MCKNLMKKSEKIHFLHSIVVVEVVNLSVGVVVLYKKIDLVLKIVIS